MLLATIFRLAKGAGSLLSHIGGVHLVTGLAKAATGGTPLGIVSDLATALGFRFFLGFGAALYFTHPGFRQGVDMAIGALLP